MFTEEEKKTYSFLWFPLGVVFSVIGKRKRKCQLLASEWCVLLQGEEWTTAPYYFSFYLAFTLAGKKGGSKNSFIVIILGVAYIVPGKRKKI